MRTPEGFSENTQLESALRKDHLQQLQETPVPKERPKLLIDVTTLTGDAGTGKSATIRSLSRLMYIPRSRIFQAGEEFRRQIREITGHEVLDYEKRSVNIDRDIDGRMTEFMRNSPEVGSVIVDGRLAGFIAKKLVSDEIAGNNKDPLRIISILLEAEEEIRAGRVLRRDIKTNADLTIEEVREKIRHRASRDLQQWRRAYPGLAEIDPLDKDLVDSNGNRVYDLVIDTGPLKVPEVVGTIYNYLLEHGHIGLTNEENPEFPSRGTIFDAA